MSGPTFRLLKFHWTIKRVSAMWLPYGFHHIASWRSPMETFYLASSVGFFHRCFCNKLLFYEVGLLTPRSTPNLDGPGGHYNLYWFLIELSSEFVLAPEKADVFPVSSCFPPRIGSNHQPAESFFYYCSVCWIVL